MGGIDNRYFMTGLAVKQGIECVRHVLIRRGKRGACQLLGL